MAMRVSENRNFARGGSATTAWLLMGYCFHS